MIVRNPIVSTPNANKIKYIDIASINQKRIDRPEA
jgi:hypothetical protein